MKKVLIINLGWEQQPLIERLHRTGHRLYAVHCEETAPHAEWFEDILVAEYRDLVAIPAYARKVKPDAVISDQCDYSAFAQAVVAEDLGLPGPTIEQQQVSVNKAIQRDRCAQAAIPIPRYTRCATFDDVRAHVDQYGFPLVLKPVDNRGSFGVNRVDHADDLEWAFFDALANSHSRIILAEEFVEGVHITIDGYVFPEYGPVSLALATKKMLGTERQVAMNILYPGELEAELYERVMRHNEEVNRKLGYAFGMLHTEYMITPSGELILIEAANRGGGVFTSELIVPGVSGIDLLGQLISDALGAGEQYYKGRVESNQMLLTFFSLPPGHLLRIDGLEKLEEDPHVIQYRFSVTPGTTINPVSTDADRHGFLIVREEGDVRAVAEKLKACIRPIYE